MSSSVSIKKVGTPEALDICVRRAVLALFFPPTTIMASTVLAKFITSVCLSSVVSHVVLKISA